jgi:hypothetical protein
MSGRDRSVSSTYAQLRKYSTRESERATHVALDGGMWRIEDWDSFWEALSQDIIKGLLFPLCELRTEVFPFFLDFDVKVPSMISKPDDFELTIVRTINKQIPKFFPDGFDDNILTAVVLFCEKRIVDGKHKYGYHIHWPNLYVDQCNAFLLRMSIIAGCRNLVKKEKFYSFIDLEEAFDIAPFKNARGSLRMLGAPKPKLCPECNNITKTKKTCNMCRYSGFITPEPHIYKLLMVLQDQERSSEQENQLKNIMRLLRNVCIHTPTKSLTPGFSKYKECPEPDVFIHNPKKEPKLQSVSKEEDKKLPKGSKNEVVSEPHKIDILQTLVPKFGTNMLENPYASTNIRKVIFGPMYSPDPKEKGKMQYVVNLQDEGSNYCPFKKDNHRGNHIYMKVCEGASGNGYATLKCYSEQCQGLTFGVKHLNECQMNDLFTNAARKNEKKNLPIKLTQCTDDVTDANNLFTLMIHSQTSKKQKI